MKTIVQGNRDYLRLLPAGTGREGDPWTPSRYLLREDTDSGTLLCNTLTGELVLLSEEERERTGRPSFGFAPALSELARHHFIVPAGTDESRAAGQLRALMLRRREAEGRITHYNILPTTYCNARCFYCYESGIRHVHMTEETARDAVRFIADHHGGSKVRLSWFGGEPMMGKQRIGQICGGLDELHIEYESDMVSNGFLFDGETARRARNAWKLRAVQITLDGTEEIYNRTKAYADAGDSPFRRVLRNISFLLDEEVTVRIRLNLDSHNAEDLRELIGTLSGRFGDRKLFSVHVRRLNEGAGFSPIQHSLSDAENLERRLSELQDLLEGMGWPQFKGGKLPCLRVTTCMAEDPATVQITPEGILGKCEDHIYDHTVGSLKTGVENREEVGWWRERTAYDGCRECPLYPSCDRLLKHCGVCGSKCAEHEREHRVRQYRKTMASEYEKWKTGRNR